MAEAIEFEDEEKGNFIMITTLPNEPSPSQTIPIPGLRYYDNDAEMRLIKAEIHSPLFDKDIEKLNDNTSQLMDILSPNTSTNGDSTMTFKDDDIFQVDQSDLIPASSLADFNSSDENFFNDLNFDDLLIPGTESFLDMQFHGTTSTPFKMQTLNNLLQQNYRFSDLHPYDNNNSHAVLNANDTLSTCPQKFLNDDSINIPYFEQFSNKILSPIPQHFATNSLVFLQTSNSNPITTISSPSLPVQSKLHDLLSRKDSATVNIQSPTSPLNVSTSGISMGSNKTSSFLSSSAPTNSNFDSIWQRREPRKHLLSTSSLVEGTDLISPQRSFDEGFNSEDDSEHYEDCSSDSDYEDERPNCSNTNSRGSSKKERFFWQYNVQSKGPKGQRLVFKTKEEDPHKLNEITDPVFSTSCPLRGLKHSGKARKGDGNDLTPNPKKLCTLGRELDKMMNMINGITPAKDRPHSRKEKNKLASRACRLKKKAQHEANKIKLFGLDQEHKNLINGITQMKHLLIEKFTVSPEQHSEVSKKIDKTYRTALKIKHAGNTTEYVNAMLSKVKNGGIATILSDT